MKRSFALFIAAALWVAPATLRAQDAATEERLNKLAGQIQDLLDTQNSIQRRLTALTEELHSLSEKAAAPKPSTPSVEDLRRLEDKLKEVDRKRESDKETIIKKIEELAQIERSTTRSAVKPPPRDEAPPPPPRDPNEKGYEYVIKSGDSVSAIVEAYRQQGVKTSVNEILKANPGLNPKRLPVNQKIFIPAPK